MDSLQTKVGIGVAVFKNGKILLGKRKGSHGQGEYASPGGHLDFGESFEECARRECLEEAGISIKNLQFMFVSNLRHYPGKHYVHIQLKAEWESGEPEVKEPDRCKSWGWYTMDNLPTPLFKTFPLLKKSLKTGKYYFDD